MRIRIFTGMNVGRIRKGGNIFQILNVPLCVRFNQVNDNEFI